MFVKSVLPYLHPLRRSRHVILAFPTVQSLHQSPVKTRASFLPSRQRFSSLKQGIGLVFGSIYKADGGVFLYIQTSSPVGIQVALQSH